MRAETEKTEVKKKRERKAKLQRAVPDAAAKRGRTGELFDRAL